MSMFRSGEFSAKVFRALLLSATALFVIHLTLKFVSIVLFDEKHGFLFELSNRFDVNDENSVPQWFSQMLFLLIAATAFLASRLQTQKAAKKLWLVLAFVGAVLSLDDVATLHEFILQTIHNTYFLDTSPTFFINAWWLFLPVVMIICGFLAWTAWRVLPRRTTLLMVTGGLVFVLGKVIMDSIANSVGDLFLERGLIQGGEKLFQYSGSAIVVYANLDYLQKHHSKKITAALSRLK